MHNLPPIHREVVVQADPETAFAVFTERIDTWWPIGDLSVFGDEAHLEFRDGQLVETSARGEVAVWGSVLAWEPPAELAFTWHPGQGEDRATSVSVQFVAVGEQTLVVLEHSGWENLAEPMAARAEYGHGWPAVLDGYADQFAADSSASGQALEFTWVALMHRSLITGSVFEDPRFAEHASFLQRRAQAGELIAAGPLGDAQGDGMTVLRLDGADQLEEAERLATQDDPSVVNGLFEVSVRPWQVVMAAD